MNWAFSSFESLEMRRFLSASPLIDTSGGDGGDAAPIFVVATPKPTQGGKTLSEYAGQKFTAKLGEFHLKVSDLQLSAVVHWGDGTTSTGKIEGSYATGDWYVEGSHKYSRTGTYGVAVDIFTKPIGSPITPTSPAVNFESVIKVKKLVPTNGGRSLTEIAGTKFNDKLGEITFKSIDLALNAEINWGDGKKSDGKLVGSYATGEYYIYGKHTYAHTGTYKVDVKVFAHLVGTTIKPTSPVASFTSVIKVVGMA
jgi:hypothetical protein